MCLVAKNKEGEATSTPVSFTTTAAGSPEAPEVAVEDATAVVNPEHFVSSPSTEAVFHGVLNPAQEGEAGTYAFVYRKSPASKPECEGPGQVTTASDIAMGFAHEEVFETVKSLVANTEYAVCVIAKRADGKTDKSVSVPFRTPLKPEAPVTKEPAADITATSAVLEGTLNPLSERVTSGYFAFSEPGGTKCTEGPTAGLEEFEEKDLKALAVHTTLGGLQPHQTYKFCLVATNSAGEATVGNEVSFETSAAPPEIVPVVRVENFPPCRNRHQVGTRGSHEVECEFSESASAVTSTAATLEAQINPNNQATKYTFEYSTQASGETLGGTITKLAGTGPLSGFGEQTASVTTSVTCRRARPTTTAPPRKNTKGEKATGRVEHFTTVPTAHTTQRAKCRRARLRSTGI